MSSRIEEFIASQPEGSYDREYHAALWSIVRDASFDPDNAATPLGLLLFLENHDFVGAGINTVTHPIAGSTTENAIFVASLASVEHPVGWWRGEAFARSADPDVVAAVDRWRRHFEACPLVEKVMQ